MPRDGSAAGSGPLPLKPGGPGSWGRRSPAAAASSRARAWGSIPGPTVRHTYIYRQQQPCKRIRLHGCCCLLPPSAAAVGVCQSLEVAPGTRRRRGGVVGGVVVVASVAAAAWSAASRSASCCNSSTVAGV